MLMVWGLRDRGGHWLTDAIITKCHLTNVHTYCFHKLLYPEYRTHSPGTAHCPVNTMLSAQTKLSVKPILLFAYWPHAWVLPQARVQVINAKPIFIASNNNKTHSQLLHTARIALGEQLLPAPLILREEGARR